MGTKDVLAGACCSCHIELVGWGKSGVGQTQSDICVSAAVRALLQTCMLWFASWDARHSDSEDGESLGCRFDGFSSHSRLFKAVFDQ
jgi:hypothetical protein